MAPQSKVNCHGSVGLSFLLISVHLLSSLSEVLTSDDVCANTKNKTTDISILVLKNDVGEWTTLFTAEKRLRNITNGMKLDVKQSLVTCGNTQVLRINGILRDAKPENYDSIMLSEEHGQIESFGINKAFQTLGRNGERKKCLYFNHRNKGKNIGFSNGGRTAFRRNSTSEWGYGSVFTNRKLGDDELFQVHLDESIDKWRGDTLTIGVILNPPSNTESLSSLYSAQGCWALYENTIFHNGSKIKENYPQSLRDIPDQMLIGVMRRSNGDLHFYENGVDMGLAARNVPSGVYGFFDVRDYASKVTITC